MKNGFLGAATLAAFCATSKVSAQTNGGETWFSHSTAKAAKLKCLCVVEAKALADASLCYMLRIMIKVTAVVTSWFTAKV